MSTKLEDMTPKQREAKLATMSQDEVLAEIKRMDKEIEKDGPVPLSKDFIDYEKATGQEPSCDMCGFFGIGKECGTDMAGSDACRVFKKR